MADGNRDATWDDGNCFVSFRLYIPLSMELLFEFRLFCCRSIRSNSAVFDRITSPPMLVMLAVSFGSVLNIDAVFTDFGFCRLAPSGDDGCDAFLSAFPSLLVEFFRESDCVRFVDPAAVGVVVVVVATETVGVVDDDDADVLDKSVFGAGDSDSCCDLYCDLSLVNGNAHFFTNWFA